MPHKFGINSPPSVKHISRKAFFKHALALPPHIPPEKQSKWRRQAHIFLKNLLLLTGTFLDDFRTGRREFFKILFISASLPSRGRRAWKGGRHCEKYRPGFGTFCPKGIKSAPCLKMRNLYNFTNGKQCKCGHTCYFWLAGGRQKCLLGSLPKPGSLGQNVPKRLAASPPLSRLFLMNKIATL